MIESLLPSVPLPEITWRHPWESNVAFAILPYFLNQPFLARQNAVSGWKCSDYKIQPRLKDIPWPYHGLNLCRLVALRS
jgi:hypothetical protein